jgi:hypothetical protein
MTVIATSPTELLALRTEPGWTAISIEICPHDAVTVIMPDADLDEMLREFERTVIGTLDWSAPGDYGGLRRSMAEHVVPAIADGDEVQIANCATVAVWLALNHPRDGALMRARMTDMRRRGLAPHLTICRGQGDGGLYGTALGEGYIDLRQHLARGIDPSQAIIGVSH